MAASSAVGTRVTRKSGLGRGLDALLPASSELETSDQGSLRMVSIDAVVPNPDQPRHRFEEESLAELTASIRSVGILQPLLVRVTSDRLSLVAGERRWRAAREAGLTEVPVLVVETDEQGALERALIENVQRANLNPIEEAAAYRQLLDEGGLTQEELADRLGRNRVSITQALGLLELPSGVQSYLIDGRLTAGHGRALLSLRGNPFQERMAQRAALEGLSVRETRDLADRYGAMTGGDSNRTKAVRSTSALAAEAQRTLSERLGTRVKVDAGKRKGKIVIEYSDEEDLGRLLGILSAGSAGQEARVVTPE